MASINGDFLVSLRSAGAKLRSTRQGTLCLRRTKNGVAPIRSDASMENLSRVRSSPRYRPPRPWRSPEESDMIRRLAFQWSTCRDRNKPSASAWVRGLGITRAWLLRLAKKFATHPEMCEEMQRFGDPTIAGLAIARERTREMKRPGTCVCRGGSSGNYGRRNGRDFSSVIPATGRQSCTVERNP